MSYFSKHPAGLTTAPCIPPPHLYTPRRPYNPSTFRGSKSVEHHIGSSKSKPRGSPTWIAALKRAHGLPQVGVVRLA